MDRHQNVLQNFAFDNTGFVVNVRDVSRGADCGCHCPVCRKPLVARQGEIREWHFAHAVGADCPGAVETALHLAAKEVIRRVGGFQLPNAWAEETYCAPNGAEYLGVASREYGWVDFDAVSIEAPVGSVRPDVVAKIDDSTWLIEIKVTHGVDTKKKDYLQQLQLPAVEISVDPRSRDEWSWADLEEVVLHSVESKVWLCCPDQNELDALAKANAMAQVPAPASHVSSLGEKRRFYVGGMIVDVTRRTFGYCVWSSYHPEVTPQVARICKSLGGQWKPNYRNWIVPLARGTTLMNRITLLSN